MITTTDAAKILGITPRRVLAMISSGRLHSVKMNRFHVIHKDDLDLIGERVPGRPSKPKTKIAKKNTQLENNNKSNADQRIPTLINDRRTQITKLCRKFGVQRLWLIGSMSRGNTTEHSDIDFLAEYGNRTPAWGMFSGNPLVKPMCELFGRKVDVVPLDALKLRPHRLARVMNEAKVYYVARKR